MNITQYINQLLLIILLALAAWLGTQAKNLYTKYINTEMKQAVCRTAVRFVEQVYQDIHGPDKLRAAMQKASELLEGYGITITDEELITMLEAAVNEFNNSFGKLGRGRHLAEYGARNELPVEVNAKEQDW